MLRWPLLLFLAGKNVFFAHRVETIFPPHILRVLLCLSLVLVPNLEHYPNILNVNEKIMFFLEAGFQIAGDSTPQKRTKRKPKSLFVIVWGKRDCSFVPICHKLRETKTNDEQEVRKKTREHWNHLFVKAKWQKNLQKSRIQTWLRTHPGQTIAFANAFQVGPG